LAEGGITSTTRALRAPPGSCVVPSFEVNGRDYPAIQVLTIREVLDGKRPEVPLLVLPTYQQAEKIKEPEAEQARLFG
jgi:hypothetical protein